MLNAFIEIFDSRINEHCIWSCIFRDIFEIRAILLYHDLFRQESLAWNVHTTGPQCILIQHIFPQRGDFIPHRDILKFFSDRLLSIIS